MLKNQTNTIAPPLQSGFTLIELMMVLVITGIIVGAVAPAFNNLVLRTQMTSAFDQLLGDLAFSRSEAVKRNQAVSICPTQDSSTCTGTDWNDDWLTFVDDGSGGGTEDDRDITGTETIIRLRHLNSSNFTVSFTNFTDAGGIRFEGNGKMEDGDIANVGEVILCDERGAASAQALSFSAFGQFRLMRDTDDSGIVDFVNDVGAVVDVSCPGEGI